jgi:transcription antitermination factor NusG
VLFLYAERTLTQRGLDTYLRLCRVKRRWSDGTKIIDQPLFPGYLFGRFHLNDRVRVLQAQGVKQILGIGNTPAPI